MCWSCALLLSDCTADIYAVLGCSGLIKNSYNRKARYRGDKVSIQIWGGRCGKADRGRHICGGRYDEAAMERQMWEGRYGKVDMGRHIWEGLYGKAYMGRHIWEGIYGDPYGR